MIRKILLLILVAAITAWFVGAHLIKGKIIKAIDDCGTDNIKLTYKDAKVSGFPFGWSIDVISPLVTIVDQKASHEVRFSQINFEFDYPLNFAKINWGKIIDCDEVRDDVVMKYQLKSDKDMVVDINFNKSLYSVSSLGDWNRAIDEMQFDLQSLTCMLQDRELFSLSSVKILTVSANSDALDKQRAKVVGDYKSSIRYLGINKAHLKLDISYLISNALLKEDRDLDFDHKIKINNALLRLDDASIALNGFLKLNRSSLPNGYVDVSMVKYQDVVDILIPEGFLISPSYVKKIISKATIKDQGNMPPASEALDFKIRFSDKRVTIGKLNLLELKL